jgi:hypothetical protein
MTELNAWVTVIDGLRVWMTDKLSIRLETQLMIFNIVFATPT